MTVLLRKVKGYCEGEIYPRRVVYTRVVGVKYAPCHPWLPSTIVVYFPTQTRVRGHARIFFAALPLHCRCNAAATPLHRRCNAAAAALHNSQGSA